MLFKDLNLKEELQSAITYEVPTPIQEQSIPDLLKGKDLIGIAQTGTGKTAAFTLPILNLMKEQYPRKIKTLVLAPTRELAAQIDESFRTYGKHLKFKSTVIFGGVSQGKQVEKLRKGVDILVATPGRLLDLLNQRKLSLKEVEFFVLDEADRMLDMGFIHDIKKLIAKLKHERQSLFFSATMSPEINKLAKSMLKNPTHVEITPQATTVELIKQHVFFVDQNEKDNLLLELLKHEHLTSVLVFTRTKHRADRVSKFLNKNNIPTDAIHGNKSQNARTKAISDFKKNKIKVLTATDIAARGIDIRNISHVINYELPNEPESYVHRIGRTARAGTDGTAFSFCEATERNFLRDIERLIKQKIDVMDHSFHSESAKNATGAAARPPPRKQRPSRNRTPGKDFRKNTKPQYGNNSRTKRPRKPKVRVLSKDEVKRKARKPKSTAKSFEDHHKTSSKPRPKKRNY